jgi:hypothetical protein
LSPAICGRCRAGASAAAPPTISAISGRRGAADDLCYLRQAHLFQTQGVGGLSTDIAHETDGYFKRLVTEAGHPESNVAGFANCHPKVAATGKIVLRYPPGVGFLLALFFRIGRLPSSGKDPNSTSEMLCQKSANNQRVAGRIRLQR